MRAGGLIITTASGFCSIWSYGTGYSLMAPPLRRSSASWVLPFMRRSRPFRIGIEIFECAALENLYRNLLNHEPTLPFGRTDGDETITARALSSDVRGQRILERPRAVRDTDLAPGSHAGRA